MKPFHRTSKSKSISHGTLQPRPIMQAFTEELDRSIDLWVKMLMFGSDASNQDIRDLARMCKLLGEARGLLEHTDDTMPVWMTETPGELLEKLSECLGEFAGPTMYFGAHPGDGSDFGYWHQEESFEPAPQEIPAFLAKQVE